MQFTNEELDRINSHEYSDDWQGKQKKPVERHYDSMKMYLENIILIDHAELII